MKKIFSTRALAKIAILVTMLVLVIYTIWGNTALAVSVMNYPAAELRGI